jgi:hypothetical protein
MKLSCCLGIFLVAICTVSTNAQAPEQASYVLSYAKHVTLDDVDAAVTDSGAIVDRVLGCSRGLVINVDEKGLEILGSTEGMSLLPLELAHSSSDEDRDLGSDQMCSGCWAGTYGPCKQSNGVCWNKNWGKCPTGTYGCGKPDVYKPDKPDVYKPDKPDVYKPDNKCHFKCNTNRYDPYYRLTIKHVEKISAMLLEQIELPYEGADDSSDAMGAIIRCVFHDAAPFVKYSDSLSGFNGCVDLTNPNNNGLQSVLAMLEKIKRQVWLKHRRKISMADLLSLAGKMVMEFGEGPYIPWKYGRKDIPCECEDTHLPGAEDHAGTLDGVVEFMGTKMGMSDRNIVAALGCHGIGALESDHAGYDGKWVFDNTKFTNAFFTLMFNLPWHRTSKIMAGGQKITEWRFRENLMFLNSDVALAFKHEEPDCLLYGDDPDCLCSEFGGRDTNRTGMCQPLDNDFGKIALEYKECQQCFFDDFVEVYTLMTEEMVPCGRLQYPRAY